MCVLGSEVSIPQYSCRPSTRPRKKKKQVGGGSGHETTSLMKLMSVIESVVLACKYIVPVLRHTSNPLVGGGGV